MVALLLGLGLPIALHVYIGLRLFTDPGWPAPWAAVGWGLLGLCFLVLLAGFRAARRSEATGFTRVIQWGAYLWLGAFGVFLTAVLASDVVGAALSLSGTVTDMHALARGRAAAVLGTVVPAVAFAFVTARGRARVERTTVALKDLGPGLEGIRVVQLSDVHVGPTLDGVWLLRVDLQLSGHTHGGQIFPFMFFVKLQQPVVQGLATVAGTRVYTHRGTGYWGPPMRLGPAPEIASLTLVGAPGSGGDSSQA
ncbi:hypothetical protein D7X96_30005 [Corallococcus interemptor]|uniref:Metallophosphoesterase n=1 Tax=Corallococcus interemptor TaxID=2316720 RepID=A0A3A8Q4C8_9BACT|nr:hypothetical protein D7X96_30005 [Corallococcus interemptor]